MRQAGLQQDQARISYLEQNIQFLIDQLHHLQTSASQPSPLQQHPSRPNLNLPQPPPLSSIASELPVFKLKLLHFVVDNQNTYNDAETQCHTRIDHVPIS